MRELRTEEEIMQNWKGDIDKPVVSVCCITYNHEKYIAEALDSFLMQETDFPFEVIVRDDASPDKTAEIIKGYEAKYPNIIKPIYEKENGYQKGIKAMPVIFEKAKGEYVALCEGDDYWTDSKKLQIQVGEMKKHPEVDMSFHPAYELIDGEQGRVLAKYADESKIFTTSEVILGDGGFCPTASLILKKEVLSTLPEWFYTDAPVGDYFIQIFGSRYGGALYIDKAMSIHRRNHKESWTYGQKNYKELVRFTQKMQISLKYLEKELDYKYSNEVNKMINKKSWHVLSRTFVPLDAKKNFYKDHKSVYTLLQKIIWHLILSKPKTEKIARYLYRFFWRKIFDILRRRKYG